MEPGKRRRVGIFGWGVVAPRSPDIAAFERNLEHAESWLEPFDGFGPNNFLVGQPDFDFRAYKDWIGERFEPRKFAQLENKMGPNVQYAIGAFIQALSQNLGLEELLHELGTQAHIYVGTGLGDLATLHEVSIHYYRSQRRWNRFWCRPQHHATLAEYRAAGEDRRRELATAAGAPPDPATADPESDEHDELVDRWLAFWVWRSEGLARYLAELKEIEGEGIGDDDVESAKASVIRRKMAARKKLNQKWGCPPEPWSSVDAKVLWNIANIPAAQISMLGRIIGPTVAPVGACSGFGVALKLADNAIQLGQAKAVVVGTTDPPPHPLVVGGFFNARVISQDGEVSKPFTEMRGTHVAGGACVWIVGDYEFMRERGFRPVGMEILSVALTADADHIITPSVEGPNQAIREALAQAGVDPEEMATWDMHATATPGDWMELTNALSIFPHTCVTARKGIFGHGMSACGGWELTAQHLGCAAGVLHPVNVRHEELHPRIQTLVDCMVQERPVVFDGRVAGKINMGVGGINACVISRRWTEEELAAGA
jgi:3-oxoacyl-[acyl-carrier-protein] synthase II